RGGRSVSCGRTSDARRPRQCDRAAYRKHKATEPSARQCPSATTDGHLTARPCSPGTHATHAQAAAAAPAPGGGARRDRRSIRAMGRSALETKWKLKVAVHDPVGELG